MRIKVSDLREYLREQHEFVLIEGRVEDAREKYSEMEDENFDFLVANQPAGSNNKYLLWSCDKADELMEDDPDRTALQIVIQTIRLFDGNKQRLEKKDLYQYKTIEEVEEAVQKLGGLTKGQKARQGLENSEKIYEDERFIVIRPHTADAACKFGSNTRWCIAASSYYYNTYSQSNNKFYFLIDKAGEKWDNENRKGNVEAKYAIVIQDSVENDISRVQAWNSNDIQVGLGPVTKLVGNNWPAVWRAIKDHVTKYSDSREVEDARKAVEDHVKSLLKGEKVSSEGLRKISASAAPTTKVVEALIVKMREYSGPLDYSDPRQEIISNLVRNAGALSPEGAMSLLQYIFETKPASGYWSGSYHANDLIRNAPFSPENFRTLASRGDDEILRNLVVNPRMPHDIIQELGEQINDIQNGDLRSNVLRRLIKLGTITPDQFSMALRSEYYIRNEIFHSPDLTQNLPPELFRMIPVTNSEEVKKLLELPNVPPDLAIDLLSKNWKLIKKVDLYEILKTINLTLDMVEKLWANNKDQHIRTSLLQNPAIGDDNVRKFSQSRNSAYRFAIAHNLGTPPEILQTMAGDESSSTRSAVAAHPNTPKETLRVLAGDEATVVRTSVASNASTALNVLNALRKDSDSFVRRTATKTLSTMTTTESIIHEMMSMRRLLIEELEDEDMNDIMNPSWRELPSSVEMNEFITVFLLQNNGNATREEISDAFQTWRGQAGAKQLWQTNRYSNNGIMRGINASGKGWFWSAPGNNKGTLFRLSPAGSSVAMSILDRYRGKMNSQKTSVSSATAKPGKTYWTSEPNSAIDITDFVDGNLTVERLATDDAGQPIRRDGEVQKVSGNGGGGWRRRRGRRRYNNEVNTGMFFKYVPSKGQTSYHKTNGDLDIVELQRNTAVQYVRPFIGYVKSDGSNAQTNLAVVKYNDRTLLVKFPLWERESGNVPDVVEPNVMPPVKKSPPPRELNPNATPTPREQPAIREPGVPRGPKTTYKVYGRHRGAPAHTRLKGQAYVAPVDTQFKNGEQAVLTPGDDGKLNVKKADGDHTQAWEPSDG
jgi:hypothetical protein